MSEKPIVFNYNDYLKLKEEVDQLRQENTNLRIKLRICESGCGVKEKICREGWIPVDERLPEHDEDGYSTYVLASFSNFTMPAICVCEWTTGEPYWHEGDEEKTLEEYGLIVNAWQPLPKPWRDKC